MWLYLQYLIEYSFFFINYFLFIFFQVHTWFNLAKLTIYLRIKFFLIIYFSHILQNLSTYFRVSHQSLYSFIDLSIVSIFLCFIKITLIFQSPGCIWLLSLLKILSVQFCWRLFFQLWQKKSFRFSQLRYFYYT